MIYRILLLLPVVVLGPTWAAAAGDDHLLEEIVPQSPVTVNLVTHAGESVQGEVAALRDDGLILRGNDGASDPVAWSEFPAATVHRVYRRCIDQTDAGQWLVLGRQLRHLPGGQELSESALEVAGMLDEGLLPQIEAVREISPPAESPSGQSDLVEAVAASGPATNDADRSPVPHSEATSYTWGGFETIDQQIFTDSVRRFADHVAETLGITFTTVETKYFLYFTNVPPRQTFHSPRLLDQMYDKACDLYGIPRGTRLFKGKCAVFMFETQAQFQSYAAEFGGPQWAAGFCQQSGNGDVRIVMFQGDDRSYTIQTMLHETAHGVSWRHRAPTFLPPWLEEGIAEWVASHTTGDFRYVKVKKQQGVQQVRQSRQLPTNLFHEPGIRETWEYGLSLAMTQILIERDREKFTRFIRSIKDGQPWEVSLRNHYGLTAEQFLQHFGRSIGVPDLTMSR